ncbi:olfactory receptor 5P50-like [Hyperolius riggenbachi]|uniref:olfactory receptor 5P50-like n=1 Tax=Hyperolius riggenbachi TaxID=752182 RepID=UPI0035A3AB2A
MCEANQTQVTQIYLLGFQELYKFKILLFIVFLLIYILILGGNAAIIILVTIVDQLKIPMFFFLKHLAAADVLLTTTIVPMMLGIILIKEGTMPFLGCIIQLLCLGVFGSVQCLVIAAMSYDRYLAICVPLRYASLMNPNVCFQLVFGSYVLGALLRASEIIVVFHLRFCHHNYIDHFFCDFGPLVGLSTSDTSVLMIQDFITSIFMMSFPLAFIIISYICISFTILNISSALGRKKAFSTCSSHLATVCTYYGTLMTIYMVPTDYSTVNMNKYRSLLVIVVTPLMNPIIYSLRNQEIKRAVLKCTSLIRTNR